ncbi:MAG: hypothetical protein GYB68_14775 [Chloroflexi bacterium]|nr:hypothetical protein [Chloroflexota bacterium]
MNEVHLPASLERSLSSESIIDRLEGVRTLSSFLTTANPTLISLAEDRLNWLALNDPSPDVRMKAGAALGWDLPPFSAELPDATLIETDARPPTERLYPRPHAKVYSSEPSQPLPYPIADWPWLMISFAFFALAGEVAGFGLLLMSMLENGLVDTLAVTSTLVARLTGISILLTIGVVWFVFVIMPLDSRRRTWLTFAGGLLFVAGTALIATEGWLLATIMVAMAAFPLWTWVYWAGQQERRMLDKARELLTEVKQLRANGHLAQARQVEQAADRILRGLGTLKEAEDLRR